MSCSHIRASGRPGSLAGECAVENARKGERKVFSVAKMILLFAILN
jgi:hypothetical protein